LKLNSAVWVDSKVRFYYTKQKWSRGSCARVVDSLIPAGGI
jgi:hypothetical protein